MQRRRWSPQGLAFGGLMAALAVLCGLVPFLGPFTPVPLVLAYIRFGGRVATLAGVVTVILSFLFRGPVQTIFFLIPSGILPGLVLGFGFKRRWKPLITGLATVAVFFVGVSAIYLGSRLALFPEGNPLLVTYRMSVEAMDRGYASAIQMLQGMPQTAQTQEQVAQLQKQREEWPAMAELLFPSMLFFGGVWFAWLNYMICKWVLRRFGHDVPNPTPFAELTVPSWLIWGFTIFLALQMFVAPRFGNSHTWVQITANVFQPMIMIFAFLGIAVAYGFLRNKMGVSKGVAIAVIVLVFFAGNLGAILYPMLAMWDTIFDIRGLGHGTLKRPEENP